MASLRDIRKRIRSVKSSRKITAAMKMVAASKLRRAQEAIVAARPYANELGALLRRVATRATDAGGAAPHPLLEVRPLRKALLVVMTSDRGLCGAFNSNILRRAERFLHEHRDRFESLHVATIGRRGRDYLGKRRVATVRDFPGVFDDLTYRRATEIAHGVAEEYMHADLDAVFLLYNEFKSAISQRVVVVDLLPVADSEVKFADSLRERGEGGGPSPHGAELPAAGVIDYVYEPSRVEVLERLVPRYLATLVWRALLESSAAEHGARMTAMDAATRNAKDLVDRLTLQYNRARQATITKELMEIVGGAEALKG